jgi:hypothetical protein
MCTVGTIYHKRTGSIKINMAEIKGCNSCIYQSTKNPPIDGVYFYPHTLIDDCIDKNDRESLLEEIFGDEGLINADDIVCFAPPLKAANKSPNTFCPFPFFPC